MWSGWQRRYDASVTGRRELRPIDDPPRAEQRAPAPPKIGLLDMLLLGAPDGKSELIDGRVLRVITLANSSEARGVFKQLARELCAFFGVEWRNRFIEGKSVFEIERAHLRINGKGVELSIEVPPNVWRSFS
jgi:hypothetical protein